MKLYFLIAFFALFSIGAALKVVPSSSSQLRSFRLGSSPLGEIDPAIYDAFQTAVLNALSDLKGKTKVR
jgi:hypothetical protein